MIQNFNEECRTCVDGEDGESDGTGIITNLDDGFCLLTPGKICKGGECTGKKKKKEEKKKKFFNTPHTTTTTN